MSSAPFGYNSRFRKRLRALSRILRYQFTSTLRPHCVAPRAWWWHYDSNFGDLLTPFILPAYGIAPVLKPVASADLVAVGSLVKALPPDYRGVVWGTGAFGDEEGLPPEAIVLALRGKLSWEKFGKPDVLALGDPGLLISEVVPAAHKKRHKLGLVAHITHRDNELWQELARQDGVAVIDLTHSPRRVAREISACDAILTTSLHGLITADSYGVPAAWSMIEPVLSGGDFKFLDHESVVNPASHRRIDLTMDLDIDAILGQVVSADSASVAEAKRLLRSSLAVVRQHCGDPVRPHQLWSLQLRE